MSDRNFIGGIERHLKSFLFLKRTVFKAPPMIANSPRCSPGTPSIYGSISLVNFGTTSLQARL